MQTQTQTPTSTPAPIAERTFDEHGNTISEVIAAPPPAEDVAAEAVADPPAAVAAPAKFRIGDREFTTQDEALTYAQSQVEVADAYRQGLQDAAGTGAPAAAGVTPPTSAAPPLNTEELFAKPEEFLNKFAAKVKGDTLTEVNAQGALREQSERIWRSFTDRHPQLAQFRGEVEDFVKLNVKDVRALAQTKGESASFDYIATKLRSKFLSYADALKPSRELPNTPTPPVVRAGSADVTPPTDGKKPLNFSEQLRSLRKKKAR